MMTRQPFSGEPTAQFGRGRWSWQYLAIALVALVTSAHLLRNTWWISGDGLHHLHRVAALTRYLMQGVAYPRWISEFAFGYGVPAFNFYSPLSYYLAQLFAPLGAVWALKLTMLAGLLASGIFLYLFARPHVGASAALVAAAIFITAPYRLVNLYPRAALAEHLAFLWLPLILWAYDGLWTGRRRAWQVISWAGLMLTHSFTALMFAPFFALYVLWSARQHHQWRPLVQALGSAVLALGLTAFFWLPLIAEAQYAGLGMQDDSRGYRNHLVRPADLIGPLIYDYTTGDGRTDYYFAFGAVPAGVLLLSIAGIIHTARRAKTHNAKARDVPRNDSSLAEPTKSFLPTYGVVVCLAALAVISRPTQPVWDILKDTLARIQFPWRFLGIATLGLALGSAGLLREIRRLFPDGKHSKQPFGACISAGDGAALVFGGLLVGLLLVTSMMRLPFKPVPLGPLDVLPEGLWAFDHNTGQAGTTWAGEFLPIGVHEQRWALGRAPEAPRDSSGIRPISLSILEQQGDSFTLAVASDQTWTFRLHAFYFPGWQVRVDGVAVPTAASGALGLVTAEIPSGAHQVVVAFEPTTVRRIGKALTTFTLMVVPLWARKSRQRKQPRAAFGAWALLVPLTLYIVLPLLPRTITPTPIQAVFGDQAQLVGAGVSGTARPGELLPVELFWFALRESGQNDKAFLHLINAEGQIVAQNDSDPGGGFTPTSRWQSGELLEDRHYLLLPEDLPPGHYRLKAGLYRFDPFQNLLTDPVTPDGRIDLGEVILK